MFCPRITRMGANLNRGQDRNEISGFALIRPVRGKIG